MNCLGGSGHFMISSATIKNFRCFKSVSLRGCKPLNVIVGRNAVGKTALLEALFLAASSGPVRGWRGLPSGIGSPSLEQDEQMWSDLFHDFDTSKQVSISLKGIPDHNRSLKISYNREEGLTPGGSVINPNDRAAQSPIIFRYTHDKESWDVRALLVGQIFYSGVRNSKVETLFFSSNIAPHSTESADRFSKLSIANKHELLIKTIRDEFPFIKGIEVLSPYGIPNIYLSIKGNSEKIAAGLVSSGINKLISILLALAFYEGGVALIDEIENGIYFDRYPALWRTIYRFARATNMQVFATTHSRECLNALSVASDSWSKDVSFYRMEDSNNIEQYEARTIFGAMKIGEVR